MQEILWDDFRGRYATNTVSLRLRATAHFAHWMIAVFAHQYMGQQARTDQTAFNEATRRACLSDRIAANARKLGAYARRMGESVEVEPVWDLAAQAALDYEVDRRTLKKLPQRP
jgi:hypothetical protein